MKITALRSNKGVVWVRWEVPLNPGEVADEAKIEFDAEYAGDGVTVEIEKVIK